MTDCNCTPTKHCDYSLSLGDDVARKYQSVTAVEGTFMEAQARRVLLASQERYFQHRAKAFATEQEGAG